MEQYKKGRLPECSSRELLERSLGARPRPTRSKARLNCMCERVCATIMAPYTTRSKFSTSVFCSARLQPGDPGWFYGQNISYELGLLGIDLVSGGGPGGMSASSKAMRNAGGKVIGICLELQDEKPNPFLNEWVICPEFGPRVYGLLLANSFVAVQGGAGTRREVWSVLDEMQTSKIPRGPVVLIGKEDWQPFYDDFRQGVRPIRPGGDQSLISGWLEQYVTLTNDVDEAVSIINNFRANQGK